MYFVIEIGTLIKRFRLANKLTFYLTTIFVPHLSAFFDTL